MADHAMLHIQCPSDHGGMIITGDPTMQIDGFPVARIGDLHSCPQVYPTIPPIPHAVTPIVIGLSMQNRPLINGRPAAFEGDLTGCGAKLLKCGSNASGVGILLAGAAIGAIPFLFLHRNTNTSNGSAAVNTSTPAQQAEAINNQITGFTDFINRNLRDTPSEVPAESKPTKCDDCP